MFTLKPTRSLIEAGIPTLSLPSYTLFNLRNSSWVITYKTWDYTIFCFGFVCTCWICSPMLNTENKTSSASFIQFLRSYRSERPNLSVGSNNAPQWLFMVPPNIHTEGKTPSLRTGTAFLSADCMLLNVSWIFRNRQQITIKNYEVA